MINVDFIADNSIGFEFSTELSIQANNVLEYICDNGKCTSRDIVYRSNCCEGDEDLFEDILNELVSYGYLVYDADGYHVHRPKQ